MAKIHLTVATPEKGVLAEEVDEVVLPGRLGEFGVLHGHTTFLAELGTGRLVAKRGSTTPTIEYQLSGGFVEVAHDRVTVLADSVS